jgi:hypothetical protein
MWNSWHKYKNRSRPCNAVGQAITPKGESALSFSFVIVDSGNEMLAIETDADTVVTATLQR